MEIKKSRQLNNGYLKGDISTNPETQKYKYNGKDVKGQESFLGIKFVTPNSLFNDTKKMKGTKVLLSPGNKTKYDFNMKVKEYKSEKKN